MPDETPPPQHLWRCRACKATLPGGRWEKPWVGPCPSCGRSRDADRVSSANSDGEAPAGQATMGGSKRSYANLHIPTGLKGYDDVVGGGLIAGRVTLLGGFAGSGKTRMLLLIADYIAKTQGRVIYATGEESADDVQSYCEELRLVNDRVTILGNQEIVEDVLEDAIKQKAFLVIWDSAQKIMSRESGGAPGSISQCKAIGSAIKKHCGVTKTCAIIVNQMSSTGDLKGGTELEHHCDTILVFGFAKANDDEEVPDPVGDEPIRVLSSTKNRKGSGGVRTYWDMLAGDIPGKPTHVTPKSKLLDFPRGGKYRKG
jgi:DNA repair protein RadA/Sms